MADKMAARNGNGIISPEMIQAIIYYQSKILKKKKKNHSLKTPKRSLGDSLLHGSIFNGESRPISLVRQSMILSIDVL